MLRIDPSPLNSSSPLNPDEKKPSPQPRKHHDFLVVKPKKQFPGKSAENGCLSLARKKVREGDNPDKAKYKHVHFLKQVTTRLSDRDISEQPAVVQVGAEEFMRLIIPRQPKERVVLDEAGTTYVQSKGVKNSQSLYSLGYVHEEKFSFEHYGTGRGFKGLGELNFLVMFMLDDADYQFRNVLYDQDDWLYKIDGGRAFAGIMLGPLLNYDNSLTGNPAYDHEMQMAYLRLIALPPELMLTFTDIYFDQVPPERKEHLKKSYYHLRQGSLKKQEKELIPGFYAYCLSAQAQTDLEEFKQHLAHFRTPRKKGILDDCPPGMLEKIDHFFENFRQLIRKNFHDADGLVTELSLPKNYIVQPQKNEEEKQPPDLSEAEQVQQGLKNLYTHHSQTVLDRFTLFEKQLSQFDFSNSPASEEQARITRIKTQVRCFKTTCSASSTKNNTKDKLAAAHQELGTILDRMRQELAPTVRPQAFSPLRAAFAALLGCVAIGVLSWTLGTAGPLVLGLAVLGGVVGLASYMLYDCCFLSRPRQYKLHLFNQFENFRLSEADNRSNSFLQCARDRLVFARPN